MVHFINFVWMTVIAIFAACCLTNMLFIAYKTHKGRISSKTATTKCIRYFLVLLAFMAIVAIINPVSIINLFKIALAAF